MNTSTLTPTPSWIGAFRAGWLQRSSLTAACVALALFGARQPAPAQNEALRYSFDEASGPALDSSGKVIQANGTFVGTGSRTTETPGGFPGTAFDAGTNGGGYIDAGDVDKLDAPSKMTITAWIRLYGNPVNGQLLVSKKDTANTMGYGVLFGLNSTNGSFASDFSLKLRVGSSAVVPTSPDLNADHSWLFVAISYDGTVSTSNFRFYSGTPTTAVSAAPTKNDNSGIPPVTSEPFRICASSAGASTVSVMVDDVRIYTNLLPIAQIEAIRQANLPPTLWWDRSNTTPGATNGVGGVANGVWSGSGIWAINNNWSTSSNGDFVTEQWSDGSVATFAAGTDAIGSYSVTVTNEPTVTGLRVEEGTIQFSRDLVTFAGSATLDVTNGASATFDTTAIAGTAGLLKTGAGTLTLNTTNTYTGNTTLSNGTVYINGSLASANVAVYAGATLAGTGTLSGGVVVNAAATVSPGASPGILTVQNGLDLSGGGNYVWELATNDTATPGLEFDQIALTGGSLALGGTSSLSINFIGTATTPTSSDPFWQASHSWVVVGLSGTASNPGDSNFGALSNATYAAGNFSTATDGGGQVVLTFTPTISTPPQFQPLVTSGSDLVLSWSAISNRNYEVLYSTNLLTTNWTVLSNITAGGSTVSIADSLTNDPARFYRVVLLP